MTQNRSFLRQCSKGKNIDDKSKSLDLLSSVCDDLTKVNDLFYVLVYPILVAVSFVGMALLYGLIAGIPYVLAHWALLYVGLGFLYGWLVKRYVRSRALLWLRVALFVVTLFALSAEEINSNHGAEPRRWLYSIFWGSATV